MRVYFIKISCGRLIKNNNQQVGVGLRYTLTISSTKEQDPSQNKTKNVPKLLLLVKLQSGRSG